MSLLACPLGSTEAARWTVAARSPSRLGDRTGAQANPSVAPRQSETVSFEVAAGCVPGLTGVSRSTKPRDGGRRDLGPCHKTGRRVRGGPIDTDRTAVHGIRGVSNKRDQRPKNVDYYRRNRAAEIERVSRRQRATLQMLRDVRQQPCNDCGEIFPPWVMQFDHRDPATKKFWLTSSRALLKNKEELIAEIVKCDIVCANCHAARTYAQLLERRAALTPLQWAPGTSRRIEEQRARWRRQAKMLQRLRDVSCKDCGRRFGYYAMQFDHRDPATKVDLVTKMIGRASDARILAEAAKCDIVCANCHAERTYRRRTNAGVAQLVVAPALQAGCRGFESRRPLRIDLRLRLIQELLPR